jgi:hypothetical protein
MLKMLHATIIEEPPFCQNICITLGTKFRQTKMFDRKARPVTAIILICATAIAVSSCKITVYSLRTDPPELDLPLPEARLVFMNYFDYTEPEYIRDRQEVTYSFAVRGFVYGLQSVFDTDTTVTLVTGDTLARRFTVISMQDSSFRDTVRTVCGKYDADMMIALDSMNLWFDWETFVDEDEPGSVKTKEFYLYSDNYLTLYSRDGEVVDRSKVQKGMVYSTRPALSALITIKPSLAKAAVKAGALAKGAGEDYAGKFYPWDNNVSYVLHNNGPFMKANQYILDGDPVKAIEPLRELTGSSNKNVAKKAGENLEVVYKIMEERRTSDEIYKSVKR